MVVIMAAKQYLLISAYCLSMILISGIPASSAVNERTKHMETNTQYQIQVPSSQNFLSLDQVKAVTGVIKAISRVIARESTLEQEKETLGTIKYNYPKDPKKTITSSSFYLPLLDFGGGFKRIDDKHTWHEGSLLIAEDQEPYAMGLTKYYFTRELGLTFDKAVLEKRENMPIPAYHVFYFHKKIGDVTLQYIFDTRPDASNLKDGYPKAFHEVRIYDAAAK